MNKYYLRIDNGIFGFITPDLHEIKKTDIPITLEDYNKFFEMQSQGKQFKLKSKPSGKKLFDYIVEHKPPIIPSTAPQKDKYTVDERIKILEEKIKKMEERKNA